MRILVTGCAGFIGFHVSKKLIQEGHKIVGIDSINNYYDKIFADLPDLYLNLLEYYFYK